jgi:hypothetical protein
MGVSGHLRALAALPPEKDPPVPIIWVGLRAGLKAVQKRIAPTRMKLLNISKRAAPKLLSANLQLADFKQLSNGK